MPRMRPIPFKVAGRRFEVDVPVVWYDEVQDDTIADKDIERAELLVAAELARDGPVVGEAIVFMRKSLALKAADLAALLGVSAGTISRWENDQRAVDRGAWVALGAMVLDRLEGRDTTIARLKVAASRKKPPKDMHLST